MKYFLMAVVIGLLVYNDMQLFKAIHAWLVGNL